MSTAPRYYVQTNARRSPVRLNGPEHHGSATVHLTLSPVKVKINLPLAVACPGHPFKLTADGSPPGGTFAWTVRGKAVLVDDAGKPAKAGATLNIRSFQPDDRLGSIPATAADVFVTYTHPRGKATDKTTIPIHGILFDAPFPMEVKAGTTAAFDTEQEMGISNAYSSPTMSTDTKVTITIDNSCLRKADCARNHRAGFLQTVRASERLARYTTVEAEKPLNTPVRDQLTYGTIPTPFYSMPTQFTDDGVELSVHHEDSPGDSFEWKDRITDAELDLKSICFSTKFDVWLVVQNIEWANHDRKSSLVFLRNYTWSIQFNPIMDLTQLVGFRATPSYSPTHIDPVGVGKGAQVPNLDDPIANIAGLAKTYKRVRANHVTQCRPLP
jgi:hypothetical protein